MLCTQKTLHIACSEVHTFASNVVPNSVPFGLVRRPVLGDSFDSCAEGELLGNLICFFFFSFLLLLLLLFALGGAFCLLEAAAAEAAAAALDESSAPLSLAGAT